MLGSPVSERLIASQMPEQRAIQTFDHKIDRRDGARFVPHGRDTDLIPRERRGNSILVHLVAFIVEHRMNGEPQHHLRKTRSDSPQVGFLRSDPVYSLRLKRRARLLVGARAQKR